MLGAALQINGQTPEQLKEVYSGSTSHFANNIEFSKDGNYMVLVVGFNADVFQKKETGFQLLQTIKGGRWQAYNPGISNDGTFITFSNFEDTYVYKKTGDSYSIFQTIRHPGKSENKDLVMRFDGNEKLMIIGGEGNIRFYEYRESGFVEVKRVINNGAVVFQEAALSANGTLLATIDGNGDLQCWRLTSGDAVPGPVILKTNKYVGILDITDDLLLASGTSDSLSLYKVTADLNSAAKVCQFPEGKFSEVRFNPDGNRVIVADKSSQLGIYKITGNSLVPEYINSLGRDNFTSIKMSEDGKWLAASSSGAKALKIFEGPVPIPKSKTAAAVTKSGIKTADKKIKTAPPAVKTKPVSAPRALGPAVTVLRKAPGKYILVDSVTQQPVSETEYDEAGKLKSGMIYITKKARYGIVRKDGQIVINPDTSKYRYIKDEPDSSGNHVGVLYDPKGKNQMGEYVLLNKQYVQITLLSYSIILNPEDGFYKTVKITGPREQRYGLLFRDGKEMLKPIYSSIGLIRKEKLVYIHTTGHKQGLYDFSGKVIVPDGFDININDIGKNKYIKIGKDGLSGFIDKTGKTIIPLKYSSIHYMDYGANSYYAVTADGKEGIVNLAFKEVIRPEYKRLFAQFEEGLPYYYATKDDAAWGWIDKTGKVVLPLIYQEVNFTGGKEGLTRATISDTSYVYVTKSGQVVFGKKFRDAGHFRSGFSYVKEKDKYGLINTSGAYAVQPVYDDIYDISNEMDRSQMYAAKKDGKWGFMDYSGKVVIPLQYDSPEQERYGYSIAEELIAVKLNNRWGYIDRAGKIILQFIYEGASGFTDGKAEVQVNGKTIIIDKTGKEIK